MAGTRFSDPTERALTFARALIGTPYRWWNETGLRGDFGPFWASEGDAPSPPLVQAQGCSCTGLINLLRRRVGLSVPGLERAGYEFAGGTWCWWNHLRKKGVLKSFDSSKKYPRGTLLLRPFRNESDQGHVAVVYSEHKRGVLYSKLIHSYPLVPAPKPGHKVAGGVMLDNAVGMSHFWDPKGFYLCACLPTDWLGGTA